MKQNMGLSESDLEQILKANPNIKVRENKPVNNRIIKVKTEEGKIIDIKARARPSRQDMNKLETSYGQFLDTELHQRKIKSWMFHPFNLRLASPKCFYEIDFLVINLDNEIELHETKGKWVDGDSLVKFKVAASTFPFFIFRWVTKDSNGTWNIKTLTDGKWS